MIEDLFHIIRSFLCDFVLFCKLSRIFIFMKHRKFPLVSCRKIAAFKNFPFLTYLKFVNSLHIHIFRLTRSNSDFCPSIQSINCFFHSIVLKCWLSPDNGFAFPEAMRFSNSSCLNHLSVLIHVKTRCICL